MIFACSIHSRHVSKFCLSVFLLLSNLSACASHQPAPEIAPLNPQIAQDLLESTQKNLIAGWARQAGFPFLYRDRWLKQESELANDLRKEFGRGQRTRLLIQSPQSLLSLQAQSPEIFQTLRDQDLDRSQAQVYFLLQPELPEVSALLLVPDRNGQWQARGWDVCLCKSLYKQLKAQTNNP